MGICQAQKRGFSADLNEAEQDDAGRLMFSARIQDEAHGILPVPACTSIADNAVMNGDTHVRAGPARRLGGQKTNSHRMREFA